MSMEFAHISAQVFANEGYKVYLTNTFVTTPTVSLLSRDKNMPFGVMITASHNPYKYNGYKLKDEFGGSMSSDVLIHVEAELINIKEVNIEKSIEDFIKEGKIEYFDGRQYYIDNLRKKIDIEKIKKANLKIILKLIMFLREISL